MTRKSSTAEDSSKKEGQDQPFNTSMADVLSQIKLDETGSTEKAEEAGKLIEGTREDVKLRIVTEEEAPQKPASETTSKAAEKQPRKSPIEITLETVNDIDSLKGLEILAYTCHRKGLLIKRDTTEVKWHVEAIDGVEGSEKLVKAIMRKHRELLNKLYAGIELKNEALRRINAVSDADELNKLAWKCHQKGLVKKIITGERENDWKVEEIEGVVGSKNIAEAIMAKKKEFGELEEDREFASNLADISAKYGSRTEEKRKKGEKKGKKKKH